jgi:hypothetical protein
MYFEIYISAALSLMALYLALSIRRVWFTHKPYFTLKWIKREVLLHGAYLLFAIGLVVLTEFMGEAHFDLLWFAFVVAPYFALFLARYAMFIPVRASLGVWRILTETRNKPITPRSLQTAPRRRGPFCG